MAPFRSNVRFFDALTAFLIALCLHMVLGMLWERGARHAQRNWSCYYVLTPSSPVFMRCRSPLKCIGRFNSSKPKCEVISIHRGFQTKSSTDL
jgi:hypothetical protein